MDLDWLETYPTPESIGFESPRRENRPAEQSQDDINIERGEYVLVRSLHDECEYVLVR